MPLCRRSAPTRKPPARVDTQQPRTLPPDAQGTSELHRDVVGAASASQPHSAYIQRESARRAKPHALPKLEYLSASVRLRLCSAKCGDWHAPLPARSEAADLVKSLSISRLQQCLAQICELSLAKMRKNRPFQTPTTRRRVLNGIKEIREKVEARPNLECPLASTNPGLGPKLKWLMLRFSKQQRLSYAESGTYIVFGDKSGFSGNAQCAIFEFGWPRSNRFPRQ